MCKIVSLIASLLLIIGGLNWGLVGLANFDLVATLFGAGSVISRVVYGLVGLSAIWKLIKYKTDKSSWCGTCDSEKK